MSRKLTCLVVTLLLVATIGLGVAEAAHERCNCGSEVCCLLTQKGSGHGCARMDMSNSSCRKAPDRSPLGGPATGSTTVAEPLRWAELAGSGVLEVPAAIGRIAADPAQHPISVSSNPPTPPPRSR